MSNMSQFPLVEKNAKMNRWKIEMKESKNKRVVGDTDWSVYVPSTDLPDLLSVELSQCNEMR